MNLFCALVGETAGSRKGVSIGRVKQVFKTVTPPPRPAGPIDTSEPWVAMRFKSGLSTGEGLIWHLRDPIPSRQEKVEDDPGVADKRMCLIEPEFASMLKVMNRPGNTLSPTIRRAWDGDYVLETLVKRQPAKATGAHVSIIGHISREELRRYLHQTEAAAGFANRFLWVVARRSKFLARGGNLPTEELDALAARMARAVDFARGVDEIDLDPDARSLWFEIYPKLSAGRSGMFGAVTARAEAQVMRLACISALMNSRSMVSLRDLNGALAIWKYCEDSARHIWGDALGDPEADKILRALRVHENGVTRTEIRDLFQRNRTEEEIERALGVLRERGLARSMEAESGGRPTQRWFATGA